MADRKWNNQGGSSRDSGRKNKIDKPSDPFDIPSFEDLKESEITSFRIVKQRQQRPNYGQFGDAVWVPDAIIDDDLIRDLEDPYRFSDLSTDRINEIKPFSESDNIKKIPLPNPNGELAAIGRSADLSPHSAKDEYELTVKFKKVILTILSGQAYAARNQFNDKKYDSSIVILSDNPISMNGGPSAVNIIQLVNGVQDPIDSLYDWMMTKTKIVTDGTGKNPDVKLLSIRRQQAGKRLPETSFTYAGKQYGLFYVSSGIQPYQICMHARNDVVKFVAGNLKDDKYWSVLNANSPLALCTPNMPTVSIVLAPGSASELEAGSGMSFVLNITVDPVQSGDTLVEYEILGGADPAFYQVTGTSFDSNGVPIVNIPNINNKQIFIEPLSNPSQTEDKIIVFKLKENDDDRYLIDERSIELIIAPSSGIPAVYFRTRLISDENHKAPNISMYVTGSNTPLADLDQIDTNDFGSRTADEDEGRKYLIHPYLPTPFLDNYGANGNRFRRQAYQIINLSPLVIDITTDWMVSKRVITDWAASENIRYVALQAFGELSFDVTTSIPIGTTDAPIPMPPRTFPDYFTSQQLSFGSILIPSIDSQNSTSGNIPPSDPLDFYPSDVVDLFGKCTIKPIQVNIFNFRQSESVGSTPYIKSFRKAFLQPAIEFDLLLDPDLESPRIVPVAINNRIDPPVPFPGLYPHTPSFQSLLPYEQVTP